MGVRNLFDEVEDTKGAQAEAGDMEATAGAMDNSDPTQCPKCKGTMSSAVAGDEQVRYCPRCRVTSPLPLTE